MNNCNNTKYDLITIIVPIYNTEKYLKKCIDSITNQTYKNIEIILIDDGSNDNSGIICDSYLKKDNRIRVFHKKNEGQAIARNIGITNSNGNYLIFVDSDDYIEYNMVEILYNTLLKTKADIVCCARFVETNKTTKIINNVGNFFVNSENGILCLINQNQIDSSPCDKIFKKELFENLRFPEGIVYEDLGLMYKLFDKANVIYHIDIALYHYNIHPNSTMTTNISKFNKKNMDELNVKREMKKFIIENYPSLKKDVNAMYYSTLIDIIIACYESKYDEDIYNNLFNELLYNKNEVLKNNKIKKLSRIKFKFIENKKIDLYIKIKKMLIKR